ncbi:hypothetical protein GCM10009754_06660 [Amycolatopsis minnesotensis]|uniref:Uncharacterized protein n=1 Tax=Amycolatopsis minnesotensis TaxID=337894 RepID=A0ABP5BGL7_9PSEU
MPGHQSGKAVATARPARDSDEFAVAARFLDRPGKRLTDGMRNHPAPSCQRARRERDREIHELVQADEDLHLWHTTEVTGHPRPGLTDLAKDGVRPP